MAEFRIARVPMRDTGLGREAGYANDEELIEAAKAERAALSPAAREIMDELDDEFIRRFLFGVKRVTGAKDG